MHTLSLMRKDQITNSFTHSLSIIIRYVEANDDEENWFKTHNTYVETTTIMWHFHLR